MNRITKIGWVICVILFLTLTYCFFDSKTILKKDTVSKVCRVITDDNDAEAKIENGNIICYYNQGNVEISKYSKTKSTLEKNRDKNDVLN